MADDRSLPASEIPAQLAALTDLDKARLRTEWRRLYRAAPLPGYSVATF